jgi:dolichyl-phosphate beta-glucosyltransferase
VSRVLLVVPCYNEARRLNVDAFRTFRLDGHQIEFCFVNDGSGDATLSLLESLRGQDPARFSVVDLDRNQGKAEAVRRGIAASLDLAPDYIGFWDADLATPLTELASFVDVLDGRKAIQMVFGARVRLLGREISRQPARHYVGRVGATLISSSLGLAIYDTQCGAKLFRASDTVRDIFSQPFLSRWLFDVEIIARFVQRWGRDTAAGAIYELPVNVWHDVKGSKVKPLDFLRALRDLLKIRRAYNSHR